MSKLVDKERLAKLAKALDQRMKAAVSAEEQRALAAEAKALEDAIKAAEEKDAVLANRIQALEGLVVGGEGEGLEAVIGDVAQNKADIAELKEFKEGHSHEELEAGIEAADAKAQAAKDAIDAFMSAEAIKEGAVDTLKEIQEYIESDGAAAEEMVAKIAAAEKAVEDEQARAEAQEAAIRNEFAAADVVVKEEIFAEMETMGNQFSEIIGNMEEECRDIRSAFELADANMEAKLKGELQAEIDADVEVEKQRAEAKELEIVNRVNELDTAINDLDMEMSSQIQGVAEDVAQLQTGQEEIGSRLGALEEFKNAHSHEAMEEAIEELQEELVGKVGEEEVKAMLGNVVSSLSLQMVDNKVQLSLGGVDGIAIAEVELDVANDDDIDEIIAGLDEE